MIKREITPKHLRCATTFSCPAVFDVTPGHLKCPAGDCLSVNSIGDGRELLIIGKKPSAELMAEIEGRVGEDECALVIGAAYFADVPPSSQGQALSGHLDFDAKARELIDCHVDGACSAAFPTAIATALREASELGAARATEYVNEITRLSKLLYGRDKFIVDQGLWYAFVDQLPASAPRQIEEPPSCGDTAAPQAEPLPDTKNLPHPIVPETGH